MSKDVCMFYSIMYNDSLQSLVKYVYLSPVVKQKT